MNLYDITVTDRKGTPVTLSRYKGKTLLIVNTATGCGFTPQYEGLEALYRKYKDQGFEILDFPCNQFGHQAPGTEEEIHQFCTMNYEVSFPQFAKIDVNGENAIPLYRYLVNEKGFEGFDPGHELTSRLEQKFETLNPNYKNEPDIKWNFTKFLVDRQGNVVRRFEPTADMKYVKEVVKSLL